MLWMLFADDRLSRRIVEWDVHAPRILASFRRDFAKAPENEDMTELVAALENTSPSFRDLWRHHDVQGRCAGRRDFFVDGIGTVAFEHSTLVVDEDNHLRLALYAALPGDEASATFEAYVSDLPSLAGEG